MKKNAHKVPQLTVRAIVLAIVLAAILAAANVYIGLFAGTTIASAIPAAVVSMAVLRALGGGGILENNIVSTGASAGCSIASGAIFTLPALIFLGAWQSFDFWWVLAITGLGGLLGVLFSVPLRRSLVVEQQMSFPEGRAAAEVLKAGANPTEGVKVLATSALAGGLIKFAAASGLRLIPDTAQYATYVGRGIAYIGTNLSPALLGVGYIVGFNVGTVMLMGGVIAWNIAIPIYSAYFLHTDPTLAAAVAHLSATDAADEIRSAQVRYLGVGAMLIGGVWALISIRKSIVSGIKSGLAATRANVAGTLDPAQRDLPMKYVLIGIVLFTLPLVLLYHAIVGQLGIAVTMAIIMVVAGFVFCSVSGYLAGLVGSSNSPVSGITICTIVFAAVVLSLLMGRAAANGPVATIMVGAVVCCAASIAGDNLQDLKCGYLIGASPWRQQLMLAIGGVASALVMAPVLNLLLKAYGMGPATSAHPHSLQAAQATLMEAVSRGLFGGHLPWTMVMIGIAIGAVLIITDQILLWRKCEFRVPVLAAAVGIYLPLELSVPIFLGGVIGSLAAKRRGGEGESENQRGMLYAAGLITGESLVGVLIAVPIVITHRDDVFALPPSLQFGGGLGLCALALLGFFLYRAGRR
jgi:putative OPT family oligopeptide transporter